MQFCNTNLRGEFMKLRDLFLYKEVSYGEDFYLKESEESLVNNKKNEYIKSEIKDKDCAPYKEGKIDKDIEKNLSFIKDTFTFGLNLDFMLREFTINFCDGKVKGFLVFFDGMSNADRINRDILRPLLSYGTDKSKAVCTEENIYNNAITQAPQTRFYDIRQVIELIEFGNCAVFIDGCECAFVADVKNLSGRDVGTPITEAVLSGPQEAFCEKIMTNLGLIRKILKDSNVVAEKMTIGRRSKTPCALMYIKGITNKSLVAEVRRRLKNIKLDYVFSSSDIEMMIEESTFFPLPQVLKTERPDRAAAMLSMGKAVIVVQGSPFALVVPVNLGDLIEASEDNYVRVEEANYMRLVRIFGILLAIFTPCGFLALCLYHHESIPSDLLFAIEATREVVPFPLTLEMIFMVLAFELIKEASIRIPDPIGSTLGIVGGLILGQAAVSANLVSPMLIIVVSIAGLGAFSVPSLSMSRAISLLQIIFIFLSAFAGFLGIALGIFMGIIALSGRTSVGVPYLAPLAPKESTVIRSLFINPIWKKEKRPPELKTQNPDMQPEISRKWVE